MLGLDIRVGLASYLELSRLHSDQLCPTGSAAIHLLHTPSHVLVICPLCLPSTDHAHTSLFARQGRLYSKILFSVRGSLILQLALSRRAVSEFRLRFLEANPLR